MRKNVVEITCDICHYDAESETYQLDGKDVCERCANIAQRVAMFGLTDRLIEAIEQRYDYSCEDSSQRIANFAVTPNLTVEEMAAHAKLATKAIIDA